MATVTKMTPRGLNVLRTSVVLLLATAVALIYAVAPWEVSTLIVGASTLLLAVLVSTHARRTEYVCPSCQRRFAISAWVDFVSPHKGMVKLLTCPDCRTVAWCPGERRQ